MFDKVTIAYRGAKYEIGQGRNFYGIWMTGAPRSQPLEWWPETAEGWSAAWTRFAGIEAPGTIVPAGRRTPGGDPGATPVSGPVSGPVSEAPGSAAPRGSGAAVRARAVAAAALLGAGVAVGVAGLFPGYLGGSSLASQAWQLIPHVIYLAVWTVSAVLILLGGTRGRIGALLAAGLSAVTFGLYAADGAMAVTGGGSAGGAGLVLALVGWLACAAGSAVAMLAGRRGAGSQPGRQGTLARPRGSELGPAVMLVLAGLGAAAAFAPAWDSFTLRTAAGQSQTLTAGNVFANPGLVIAGDVAVMAALAAAVIVAAFWRPVRHGAALLAGAVIPMAALAVSALVQVGVTPSPAQFGITPAQASQLGLTISAGVTPAFWIYCGFLVVLAVSCAWMLLTPHPVAGGYGRNPAPHDHLADEDPGGDGGGSGDSGDSGDSDHGHDGVTSEPAR